MNIEGHYIAYLLPGEGPLEEGGLPRIGKIEGKNFHHYGGITRMPFDPKGTVLKDYGLVKEDTGTVQGKVHHWENEKSREKIFEQFHADFPPLEATAAEMAEKGAGWISPKGEVYACHYAGHANLANRLCYKHKVSHDTYDEQDDLEKAGWLKVSPLYISRNWDKRLKKAQTRCIEEVMVEAEKVMGDNKTTQSLFDTCKRYLESVYDR